MVKSNMIDSMNITMSNGVNIFSLFQVNLLSLVVCSMINPIFSLIKILLLEPLIT
jgi:hypothetical protein